MEITDKTYNKWNKPLRRYILIMCFMQLTGDIEIHQINLITL